MHDEYSITAPVRMKIAHKTSSSAAPEVLGKVRIYCVCEAIAAGMPTTASIGTMSPSLMIESRM